MAAVINLDTVRLTRNIETNAPREPVSAEIILFPGIRYERWEHEASESSDGGSLAPERDKLVLSQD